MPRPLSPWIGTFILLAIAAASRVADGAAAPLTDGGRASVSEIVDGDTLRLTDGREVRLVGIQAPKLPPGRAGPSPWPLAAEAKQALAELALGREVELAYGGAMTDRYGRALAQLHAADGTWIQGEMLKRGMARVYSFADNRALVTEMLALEGEARAAGRGIWADPFYRILAPEDAEGAIGSFQLVEGRVASVRAVRGRTYVNFGADWKSDFTLLIDGPARRQLVAAGLQPDALEGRRVRVRGWLRAYNGPLIEITHSEQIELLAP